jgi:cob(I)alamin adenosyltransferase
MVESKNDPVIMVYKAAVAFCKIARSMTRRARRWEQVARIWWTRLMASAAREKALQEELDKSRSNFNELHSTLWKRIDETREKGRADLLKIAVLQQELATSKEARENLRTELTMMQQAAETRNRELDALHYVWCSGGCAKGTHRYCDSPDEITEETVQIIERQATRLRSWFENHREKQTP